MKNVDLNELELGNIGAWPMAVKATLIVIVCIITLVLGYFLDIQKLQEDLDHTRRQEDKLKEEFKTKQAKAANLEAYKQQMKEMEESFGAMLRQLPSKTEVDDLLVDISQTGLASGIQFKLFKPLNERQIEFYAELPINMVVTGTYHEFGEFASGVAMLPRIVTLENISISKGKGKGSNLTMKLTAKTYRYLDENELAAQKKKKKKKKKRRR